MAYYNLLCIYIFWLDIIFNLWNIIFATTFARRSIYVLEQILRKLRYWCGLSVSTRRNNGISSVYILIPIFVFYLFLTITYCFWNSRCISGCFNIFFKRWIKIWRLWHCAIFRFKDRGIFLFELHLPLWPVQISLELLFLILFSSNVPINQTWKLKT